MSTTTECRREDLTCQPDKTIIAEKPEKPECAAISEKQFMRDHTMYSAVSSWLFAIAGATTIGVLGVVSSKVLSGVEQGKPIFKSSDPKVPAVLGNKKFNRAAIGMAVFGAVPMAVSNWLESKKVVTEWQLGAGKLQRKSNIAEKELEKASPAEQTALIYADTPAKNWADSVHAEPAASRTLASIAFVIALALPFAGHADIGIGEEQFLRDKSYAQNLLSPKLEQQCLADISKKIDSGTRLNPTGKPHFSDRVSRIVYQQFYWKDSDRGVAFVMPVQAQDKRVGSVSTDIACFYSMTETGLEFQLSQQIIWRL